MLTEAADLLGGARPARPLAHAAHRTRTPARRATRRWPRTRMTRSSDDIADPMSQRESVHREVAERIETALRPLADVHFTSVRTELTALVAL